MNPLWHVQLVAHLDSIAFDVRSSPYCFGCHFAKSTELRAPRKNSVRDIQKAALHARKSTAKKLLVQYAEPLGETKLFQMQAVRKS